MRLENVGVGMVGAVAIVSSIIAGAIVWLLLTDPVTVASVVADTTPAGPVSPLVRDLAAVIVTVLQRLLKYL
jgi:hypothetical protein